MKVFRLLNTEQIQTLNQAIQNLEFEDGKNSAYGSAKKIKQNFQVFESNPDAAHIFRSLRSTIFQNDYIANYAFPQQVVSPRIASYKDGGHYGWHVDKALMNGLRTDLSFTLMLSGDYEGGNLEFDTGISKHSIQLQPGEMIVYPTGVLHQVTPVTKGERLCIVGWIQSAVKSHDDRELLFKMAREIARLRDQYFTDQDELTELNYLYTQFLRRLAD